MRESKILQQLKQLNLHYKACKKHKKLIGLLIIQKRHNNTQFPLILLKFWLFLLKKIVYFVMACMIQLMNLMLHSDLFIKNFKINRSINIK